MVCGSSKKIVAFFREYPFLLFFGLRGFVVLKAKIQHFLVRESANGTYSALVIFGFIMILAIEIGNTNPPTIGF